jgi:hypothetical protein
MDYTDHTGLSKYTCIVTQKASDGNEAYASMEVARDYYEESQAVHDMVEKACLRNVRQRIADAGLQPAEEPKIVWRKPRVVG